MTATLDDADTPTTPAPILAPAIADSGDPAPDPAALDVEIIDVTKRFGDVTAVDRMRLQHRPRLVLLVPRPVGLRQDDDAADDRRLRAADERRDPPRR